MRARSSSLVWRAPEREAQGRRSPESASSRLSQTVCGSNTVGFWNLRPMPRVAIAGSSSLREVDVGGRYTTRPSSGRVLPVMTSIIVVLPAPLGPITARISPGREHERQRCSAP